MHGGRRSRPGSANYDQAIKDGFKPVSAAEATEAGDLVNILLPDEVQGDIYVKDIRPHLRPGNLLLCSHGFNIHFGQVVPPEGVDCALVAPKGPGHLVRSEFVKGGGVPCLIATTETTPARQGPKCRQGEAVTGGTRGGVLQTTFAEETETTPGGRWPTFAVVSALWSRWALRRCSRPAINRRAAYFECLHELKLIVDLMYQGGLDHVQYLEHGRVGDYTRGPRIINEQTRAEMRKILHEIRSGQFAREWILENKANRPTFNALRRLERQHPVEEVGKRLRGLGELIDVRSRSDSGPRPERLRRSPVPPFGRPGRLFPLPRLYSTRLFLSVMADRHQKAAENVTGRYYVDVTCIDCDLCRETAPLNFARQDADGHSYVFKQPGSASEEAACQAALEECPVEAIGRDGV
ncbi:MAG: ketol-acid reductoisomerase [Isosphaeraceae bacterium]